MVAEKDASKCLQLHERERVRVTQSYLWQGSAGWRWWWRGSQGRRRRRRRRGGDWHAEVSDTCRNKHSHHPIHELQSLSF